MNINEKKQQIKIRKLNKIVLKHPNKLVLYKDGKYKRISVDFSKYLICAANKKDIELFKQQIKGLI